MVTIVAYLFIAIIALLASFGFKVVDNKSFFSNLALLVIVVVSLVQFAEEMLK